MRYFSIFNDKKHTLTKIKTKNKNKSNYHKKNKVCRKQISALGHHNISSLLLKEKYACVRSQTYVSASNEESLQKICSKCGRRKSNHIDYLNFKTITSISKNYKVDVSELHSFRWKLNWRSLYFQNPAKSGKKIPHTKVPNMMKDHVENWNYF